MQERPEHDGNNNNNNNAMLGDGSPGSSSSGGGGDSSGGLQMSTEEVMAAGGRGRFYLEHVPAQALVFIRGKNKAAEDLLQRLDMNAYLKRAQKVSKRYAEKRKREEKGQKQNGKRSERE